MNERLAFFCDRDAAPGHLCTWVGTHGDADTLYQVWSRAPFPDPGADPDPDGASPARARLAAAGGGLIAATRQSAAGPELRVETVPGADYDPATELVLLSPGETPQRLPLDGTALPLAPGTFVLLPATRADQANLHTFLAHLERLPDDYRGLLLNVLRRPGIEGALWQLEARLARLQGDPPPGLSAAADQAPGPRLARAWPWTLAGLLLLNLLAVLGSAWWLKGGTSEGTARQVETGDAPTAPWRAPGGALQTPPPGLDRSWCGPPWFCGAPLAPGPREAP